MAKTETKTKDAGHAPARAQATAAPARRAGTLMVCATALGYYKGARRRPGTVFKLEDATHFATTWMEWAAADAAPREAPSPATRDDDRTTRGGADGGDVDVI